MSALERINGGFRIGSKASLTRGVGLAGGSWAACGGHAAGGPVAARHAARRGVRTPAAPAESQFWQNCHATWTNETVMVGMSIGNDQKSCSSGQISGDSGAPALPGEYEAVGIFVIQKPRSTRSKFYSEISDTAETNRVFEKDGCHTAASWI